ncbi:MAG: phosphate signaling complex protein PhoU [Breznakibacter sp.]
MKLLEKELKILRQNIIEMTLLVTSQIEKACEAFDTANKNLALEVIANERRINAYELKMDADCENMLALYTPVAADLRFVMASYNIASTLERIADNAAGIARYVLEMDSPIAPKAQELIRFKEMETTVMEMMEDALDAFEEETPGKAYNIPNRDLVLNEINIKSSDIMVYLIKENPDDIKKLLFLFSTIKKMERIGDLIKNIAEETIFYIEAKVIKHLASGKEVEDK